MICPYDSRLCRRPRCALCPKWARWYRWTDHASAVVAGAVVVWGLIVLIFW